MCIITLAILLSVLYPAYSLVNFNDEGPFVWTKLGGLRGVYEHYKEKKVAAFLGVPFAQPPIDGLRFEKPQPVKHWRNSQCPSENKAITDCTHEEVDEDAFQDKLSCEGCIRDAKKFANSCMLTPDGYFPGFRGSEMWNPPNTSNISEDCLYLNMWVPENPSGEVLVWIFGGGFFSGSPSLDLYNGAVLAANHSLVVVNLNYRLGPFGFLYLGAESNVTGNMGLLDQQMALRCVMVRQAFGGNPQKVTLLGESAGSASVTAHLLANGSHPFFSKVICLSGSVMNLWATRAPETIKNVSLELARNLSCTDQEGSESVLDCLKEKNASVIQSAADAAFGHEPPMSFPFVPINEDNVFFHNKNFKKNVSAIFGTVNDEGTFWLPYYLSESGFAFNSSLPAEAEKNQALINESQYNESMNAFMFYFDGSTESKEELYSWYKNFSSRNQTGERLRDGVGQFLGDLFFTCNLTSFADIFADENSNSVYVYHFNMRSSANLWPRWMGVMHGYEIEFMFGQPFGHPYLYNATSRKTEKVFSTYLMNMWAKFVENRLPPRLWKKYTPSGKVLLLDENSNKINTVYLFVPHASRCDLIRNATPVPSQPNITSDEHV